MIMVMMMLMMLLMMTIMIMMMMIMHFSAGLLALTHLNWAGPGDDYGDEDADDAADDDFYDYDDADDYAFLCRPVGTHPLELGRTCLVSMLTKPLLDQALHFLAAQPQL